MIGSIDNPEHYLLIEEFERRNPNFYVHVTTMYTGFGNDETRKQVICVVEKTTDRTISDYQGSVETTLMIAELRSPEKKRESETQRYDVDIVTRYPPKDLKESGWRCRVLWSEKEQQSGRRLTHMALCNARHERVFDTYDDLLSLFDFLVGDARALTKTLVDS